MQNIPSLVTQTVLYEPTEAQCFQHLLSLIPSGNATAGFRDSKHYYHWILRGIAAGLSLWFKEMNKAAYQVDYSKADTLLHLHEKLHGIPNDLIPLADTIQERRYNVFVQKRRLYNSTLLTLQDYIGYLTNLGLEFISIEKINEIPEGIFFPLGLPMYVGEIVEFDRVYLVKLYDGEEYEENNERIKFILQNILNPIPITWKFEVVTLPT
jgi:hypothetical protein